MQIAIFVVLVIIALVLAPWLIGVAAALVAAYGVIIVVLGGIAILSGIAVVLWVVMTDREPAESPPLVGARTSCRYCQAEISSSLAFCDNCHHEQ